MPSRHATSRSVRAHSVPERIQARTGRRSSLFDLAVVPGSVADGRLVSDVAVGGVFGRLDQFVERLEVRSESPT